MKPQKLGWVTTSLIVLMVLGALNLLLLPFIGTIFNLVLGAAATDSTNPLDPQSVGILKLFTGSTLWITALFGIAWLVFQFFTYRALLQGKSWARVAGIVIAILALLNFPFGTIAAIFMLIGLFDPEVQAYARA